MESRHAKRVTRLEKLIAKHPNTEVSFDDSYMSGNCASGTANFANAYFPNRESVTLEELKPYLDESIYMYEVCMVILYKLKKLGEELPESINDV